MNAVALVARLHLKAAARDRGAFILGFFIPVVLLGTAGLLAFAVSVTESGEKDASTTVAVARTEGADALVARLRQESVQVVVDPRPQRQLFRSRADVAVEILGDADRLLRDGESVAIRLFYVNGRDDTFESVANAEVALIRAGAAVAGRTGLVAVSLSDVSTEPQAAKSLIARGMPTLLVLLALPFFNGGLRSLLAAKRDRTSEHLMALPMSRRHLLIGLGTGSAVTEAMHQALFVGPFALALVVLAVAGRIPALSLLVVAATALAIAALALAAGLAIGSYARSENTAPAAIATAFGVAFAVMFALGARDAAGVSTTLSAIPGVGVLAASEAAVADALHGDALAISLASSLAGAAILLGQAIRQFEARGGLRLT